MTMTVTMTMTRIRTRTRALIMETIGFLIFNRLE